MCRSRLRCRFGTELHDKYHSVMLIQGHLGAYGSLSISLLANLYLKAVRRNSVSWAAKEKCASLDNRRLLHNELY